MHAEDMREFLLYDNTRKALIRVIVENIEAEFIADLEDENVGFDDHTVMELLTYLGDEYATIEPPLVGGEPQQVIRGLRNGQTVPGVHQVPLRHPELRRGRRTTDHQ